AARGGLASAGPGRGGLGWLALGWPALGWLALDRRSGEETQQLQRARFEQRVIAISALRGLHARWASGLALARPHGLRGRGHPPAEIREALLREPRPAGITVVHEHRGQPRVRVLHDRDPTD